jgi:hypothetical protein
MKAIRFTTLLALAFVIATGPVWAADLSGAKNVVNPIRLPDPPQVSTTTKPSPAGQPVTNYHPAGPSVNPKPVPSPVNKNNPRNDPDVQRGFNQNQKAYYGK